MNRFNQIMIRADQLSKTEKAFRLFSSKEPFACFKALVFAACTLFVAFMPAGGAALTLL